VPEAFQTEQKTSSNAPNPEPDHSFPAIPTLSANASKLRQMLTALLEMSNYTNPSPQWEDMWEDLDVTPPRTSNPAIPSIP
jgi:hypothetical protein